MTHINEVFFFKEKETLLLKAEQLRNAYNIKKKSAFKQFKQMKVHPPKYLWKKNVKRTGSEFYCRKGDVYNY